MTGTYMTQQPMESRLKDAQVPTKATIWLKYKFTPLLFGNVSRTYDSSKSTSALMARYSVRRISESGWTRRKVARAFSALSSSWCMRKNRGDSGKNIMPIPRIRAGRICIAKGNLHEASLWPVQPFGPTSWRGSKVGLADVPPEYGIFGAHLVPPMY